MALLSSAEDAFLFKTIDYTVVTFLDVSESVDGDTSSITSFTSYEWEKEIKKKMEDAKIYKPD